MKLKQDLGKVGLGLTGCGSRGAVQIAMIKAFLDLGLNYDVLSATSAGGLNACMLHQGEVDEAAKLWSQIRTKDVYTSYPWDALGLLGKSASLYNSEPLGKLIKSKVRFDKLKENPRQLLISATDLNNHTSLVLSPQDFLDQEEFIEFVWGAASPPIYFKNRSFRGTSLCDGGLIDNFQIYNLFKSGCDTIVILYPTNYPPDPPVKSGKDMLDKVVEVPSDAYLPRELGAINTVNKIIDKINESLEPDYRKVKVVIVQPKEILDIPLLDFDMKGTGWTKEKLFEVGYRTALETLTRELFEA